MNFELWKWPNFDKERKKQQFFFIYPNTHELYMPTTIILNQLKGKLLSQIYHKLYRFDIMMKKKPYEKLSIVEYSIHYEYIVVYVFISLLYYSYCDDDDDDGGCFCFFFRRRCWICPDINKQFNINFFSLIGSIVFRIFYHVVYECKRYHYI